MEVADTVEVVMEGALCETQPGCDAIDSDTSDALLLQDGQPFVDPAILGCHVAMVPCHTVWYGADMVLLPDPVWPVVVLAAISFADGLLCVKPVAFIAQCYRDVNWPRSYWWLMPPIKFAAAAGLIAGIWIPGLGLVTSSCLVLYFVVAIAMHVRARDFGRNLFLNAVGMLLICLATLLFCFLI